MQVEDQDFQKFLMRSSKFCNVIVVSAINAARVDSIFFTFCKNNRLGISGHDTPVTIKIFSQFTSFI